MRVAFSSRRQELTPDQHKALEKVLDRGVVIVEKPVAWSVTADRENDTLNNREQWRTLADGVEAIVGDFPHAALEALATFSNLEVPVLVRLYAIGGGFKRDTEFVRWGYINADPAWD